MNRCSGYYRSNSDRTGLEITGYYRLPCDRVLGEIIAIRNSTAFEIECHSREYILSAVRLRRELFAIVVNFIPVVAILLANRPLCGQIDSGYPTVEYRPQ